MSEICSKLVPKVTLPAGITTAQALAACEKESANLDVVATSIGEAEALTELNKIVSGLKPAVGSAPPDPVEPTEPPDSGDGLDWQTVTSKLLSGSFPANFQGANAVKAKAYEAELQFVADHLGDFGTDKYASTCADTVSGEEAKACGNLKGSNFITETIAGLTNADAAAMSDTMLAAVNKIRGYSGAAALVKGAVGEPIKVPAKPAGEAIETPRELPENLRGKGVFEKHRSYRDGFVLVINPIMYEFDKTFWEVENITTPGGSSLHTPGFEPVMHDGWGGQAIGGGGNKIGLELRYEWAVVLGAAGALVFDSDFTISGNQKDVGYDRTARTGLKFGEIDWAFGPVGVCYNPPYDAGVRLCFRPRFGGRSIVGAEEGPLQVNGPVDVDAETLNGTDFTMAFPVSVEILFAEHFGIHLTYNPILERTRIEYKDGDNSAIEGHSIFLRKNRDGSDWTTFHQLQLGVQFYF